MAESEVEYESDPEEAKLSLKMRRREASDDEEEEEGGGDDRVKAPRRIYDSEGESEGAAAEYEDDLLDGGEYEIDEEYAEDGESGYVDGGGAERGDPVMVAALAVNRGRGAKESAVEGVSDEKKGVLEHGVDGDVENSGAAGLQHEEPKKELDPFSVPTAGAFYMHDDRFRDNAGGRNRRTLGGRKLWESKDERKWGHDKFEELSTHQRHHEEHRRGFRGRYRGRGRNQGGDHVYTQANRQKENTDYSTLSNNQVNASKGVRGRGPRRYQTSFKNYEGHPMAQKKLSGKSADSHLYNRSGSTSELASNPQPEKMLPRKQVASSLNVASPPFYPTGSSTKDTNMARDIQSASINHSGQQSYTNKNINVGQSSAMMRGKNMVDSVNVDRLYIDDSPAISSGKQSSSVQMPLSSSLDSIPSQSQFRSLGRGLNPVVQMPYQPLLAGSQLNRAFSSSHLQSGQLNPGQFLSQTSGQQFVQSLPSRAQVSSPPKTDGTVNLLESENLDSASETNQSKTALVSKGRGSTEINAKGSFIYGGAQVIGAPGSTGRGHTDQNFPAFLPVMQFGGQHPGGIGVPALGMAFPGYVGQPQLGIGSSEMTWLPVLAGAAGALGATYCPPYITVDGSYNPRPSAPASSVSPSLSKENNGTEVENDWGPTQRAEHSAEEVSQRPKNPRRYTEMKFNQ